MTIMKPRKRNTRTSLVKRIKQKETGFRDLFLFLFENDKDDKISKRKRGELLFFCAEK